MKAKQLGTVVFMYPQEMQQECTVMGDKVISAAGTAISYDARLYNPEITLASAADDWLNAQNIADIGNMCASIGTTYILTLEDDSTKEVYFDHSRDTVFTEIQDGVCFYYGSIALLEI